MSAWTGDKQSRLLRVLKSKLLWLIVLIAVVAVVYVVIKIQNTIAEIKHELTPPVLPTYTQMPIEYVNPHGWGKGKDTQWIYHESQGTATLPIPYQWLLALEEPRPTPWHILFGSGNKFVGEYLLRIGFIESDSPDGLPIGIAKTESIYFPGIDRNATAAGFTCAACHTGQMVQGGTRYVIDGGPAMTDLGLLTASLGAALGQTALSSHLPIFNGRFERFAKNVLGSNYSVVTRNKLKDELTATLKLLGSSQDVINVTEGFTRLDALNRIGNQVFDRDINKPGNYAPIDAPVNYPHIWTTSWFDWVQYDASIMQPLIRNSGEALGVAAYVNTETNKDENQANTQYSSSIPVRNLHEIEYWMSGDYPFDEQKHKGGPAFNGLPAPKWPASFPKIDQVKASQGKALYNQYCQGCHLPVVGSPEFWSDKYWKEIVYSDKSGDLVSTAEKYLALKVISQQDINTDPAQGDVLVNRTVDTIGLGLNTDICTLVSVSAGTIDQPGKENAQASYDSVTYLGTDEEKKAEKSAVESEAYLAHVTMKDSATASYALALGAFVQETNDQWFKQNYITEEHQKVMEGGRPNCLQAGAGYKARPLNGIWATAPFLHNGSVASVYDLLSTQNQRPTFVELGNLTFDTEKLGIVQGNVAAKLNHRKDLAHYKLTDDYQEGRFILDTREPGNFNTGHIFDDQPIGNGVIGPRLTEDEKRALIEYLKTL